MRRSHAFSSTLVDENPFSLSLGDLMAGLLLIFVLLLSSVMLNLMAKERHQLKIAENYRNLQEAIYQDLSREFEKDLEKWKADLNKESLAVRFREPDVLFDQGKVEVKTAFKEILEDFFPRYIGILKKPEYVEDIEEIRIEGHTSSEWSAEVSDEDAYFRNMELSQHRTRSVLQFVLQLPQINENRDWVKRFLTANGLSSSRLITNENDTENQEESRRVEFRVRTNSEKQLIQILGELP